MAGNIGIEHRRAITQICVNARPEQQRPAQRPQATERPALHDLSASQSEAARSECVVPVKDAGGERAWKLAGDVHEMYINGVGYVQGVDYGKTLYASPYLVVDDEEYTKHYYIEGERVCTKIGGHFSYAPTQPLSAPISFISYSIDEFKRNLRDMVDRGIVCSEFNPDFVTIDPYLGVMHRKSMLPETNLYFYHPDHLGSSSFITDAMGYATQHLQYLPFGETFVDQQNGYDSRYTFSAKENDDETQYSYFGARYYDSDLSVWLSVDPLAKNYPMWSPYIYTGNNPVKFIDIDGLGPGDPFLSEEEAVIDFAKSYNDNSIQKNREYHAAIYSYSENGKTYYSYTTPIQGSSTGGEGNIELENESQTKVAEIHTHGKYQDIYNQSWRTDGKDYNNEFSDEFGGDIQYADKNGIKQWVITPNGSVKYYQPEVRNASGEIITNRVEGKVEVLDIPFDRNDPSSPNSTDYSNLPKNEPYRKKAGGKIFHDDVKPKKNKHD